MVKLQVVKTLTKTYTYYDIVIKTLNYILTGNSKESPKPVGHYENILHPWKKKEEKKEKTQQRSQYVYLPVSVE